MQMKSKISNPNLKGLQSKNMNFFGMIYDPENSEKNNTEALKSKGVPVAKIKVLNTNSNIQKQATSGAGSPYVQTNNQKN